MDAVHFAIIMVQAIGHHQVLGIQLVIVAGNLVKGALVYSYFGRLALHQQEDTAIWIEHHDVIPFFQLVHCQLLLHIDQALREVFGKYQKMEHMLAYPFLRL